MMDHSPPRNTMRKNTIFSIIFRLFRVVIVLAIAVALAFALVSLKKKPEKNEIIKTPPSVNIIVANTVSKEMTVEAFGTVKPRKSVKISVEVPGRIVTLHPSFIEGGIIQKGDLLIQIDPQSYQLEKSSGQVRINQAQTDIDNFKQEIINLTQDIILSKANLDLAKKELGRVKTLTQNKYASINSLDRTEQQYLQAKMQLQTLENRLLLTDTAMDAKQASLSMARVDFQKTDLALKRTQIRSSFDGLVLEKKAEIGEYVNPGQTLGVIYQRGKMDVDVRIPIEKTQWLNGFFDGDNLPAAQVMMANSSGGDVRVWKGRVARLKAKIDEQTRTLPLTIEIMSDDISTGSVFGLKPGSFVKCAIVGETIKNIFVVPRYLLKQGDILFTVDDKRLKMKRVNILRKFEDEIYIDGGLVSGDKIISSPLPGALNGMELSIFEDGK